MAQKKKRRWSQHKSLRKLSSKTSYHKVHMAPGNKKKSCFFGQRSQVLILFVSVVFVTIYTCLGEHKIYDCFFFSSLMKKHSFGPNKPAWTQHEKENLTEKKRGRSMWLYIWLMYINTNILYLNQKKIDLRDYLHCEIWQIFNAADHHHHQFFFLKPIFRCAIFKRKISTFLYFFRFKYFY